MVKFLNMMRELKMEILLTSKRVGVTVEMGATEETAKMVSVEIGKILAFTIHHLNTKVALVGMEVMEHSVATEETEVTLK